MTNSLQQIIDRHRSESSTNLVSIAVEILIEAARLGSLRIRPGQTPNELSVVTPRGEDIIDTDTPLLSGLCAALASVSAKLAGAEFSPYHTEVTFTKNIDKEDFTFDVRIWNTNADRRILIDASSSGTNG